MFEIGDLVRFVEDGNGYIESYVLDAHGYLGVVVGPERAANKYDLRRGRGYSVRALATGELIPLIWASQMEKANV